MDVTLTAHYAMLAHKLASNGELDWKRMRELCSDILALRRGDHSAQMVAQFVRWAKDPAVQALLRRHGISAEERGSESESE